jgi:hypothetical protein
VDVSITTVKGQVTVAIAKDEMTYRLTLQSPPGTTATVGIPKKAFARLDAIDINGAPAWKGRYVGRLDGMSWNGEDDRYVKFDLAPGTWSVAGRGKLDLSTPKPPSLKRRVGKKLSKKSWKVSASIDNQSYKVGPWQQKWNVASASAENAIDGDSWTGWRTMKDQEPGQWFAIDMGASQEFDRIVLDCTWAIHDSPVTYEVYASNNPDAWGDPVARGKGSPTGITVITFDTQNARHIKIVQTGMAMSRFWSIFEVDVYSGLETGVK